MISIKYTYGEDDLSDVINKLVKTGNSIISVAPSVFKKRTDWGESTDYFDVMAYIVVYSSLLEPVKKENS